MQASASSVDGFSRSEKTYTACASMFVVVLVLTNVIGTKLFVLNDDWPPLTTGIITYPLTFLLTDLVSEIWGRKRANFMVLAGFAMSLLMLAILQLAIALPPSQVWTAPGFQLADEAAMQNAYHATFSNPATLLGASMTAYLVAQLCDVRLYHFWWKLTRGKHMWLRNNGSTFLSQLVDTIIVNSIFLHFGLKLGWSEIGEIIVAVYVCKMVLALLDTPLIYIGRALLERFLGIEHDAARGRAPLA